MSKRKIQEAFARGSARAEASKQLCWPDLECPLTGRLPVPEEYLQEVSQKFEEYTQRCLQHRKALQKAAAAAAAASAAWSSPGSAAADAEGGSDQRCKTAGLQALAAFCVQQLGMWPGSGVVLQQQQQEVLLHIVANHDVHLDPLISVRALQLLLQNLHDHAPIKLVTASDPQNRQLPVLQCGTVNGLCWTPFRDRSEPGAERFSPLLPEAGSPFPLLQQLVSNAVQLVTGGRSSSGGGASSTGSSSSSHPSQGQAMLLMFMVELLQSDLLPRLAAFEQYQQLKAASSTDEAGAAKLEAAQRSATVLQHSLLYRVMQDDSVGGDAWKFVSGQRKGKHQLVRDLLLLASCTGGEAASSIHTRAAPATSKASATAGAVPVSAAHLVSAARRLLLMLLQLFSSCEEAGVYGGNKAAGRHQMPNDRFEMDEVLMTALGTGGHVSVFKLPELQQYDALQRILQLLPDVHRVRLLSLMVVESITSRPVDPESEGDKASTFPNMHIQGLKKYCSDRGKGTEYTGFRQPIAAEILKAVKARLPWAVKAMFGGGQLFALYMAALIGTAAPGMQVEPREVQQEFRTEVAEPILQRALEQEQQKLAGKGCQLDAAVLHIIVAAQQKLKLLAA